MSKLSASSCSESVRIRSRNAPGLQQLVQHEADGALVVARGEHLARDAPHRGELPVEALDASLRAITRIPSAIDVERRLEQRQRSLALALDVEALGHVAEAGDDAAHGGVVELVDDVHAPCAEAPSRCLSRKRAPHPRAGRGERLERAAERVERRPGGRARAASSTDEVLRPVARHALARGAQVGEASRPIQHADDVGAVLDQRPEALLARLLRGLGPSQDVQLADQVEPAHEQRPGDCDLAAQRQ